MATRQRTINKYAESLKELLEVMEDNSNVSVTSFIRSHNLPGGFTQACSHLGYIKITGNRRSCQYYPLMNSQSVEPRHGRRIAETVIELKQKRQESKKDKGTYVKPDLTDIPAADLAQELKRRGYHGKLQRVEEISISNE